MKILFDEKTHQYYEQLEHGRRTIKSVTQILSNGFHGDSWYYKRGKALHNAIHYYAKGTLDISSVTGVIKPYFDAFLRFMDNEQMQIIDFEKIVYCDDPWEYAGRYDLNLRKYKIVTPFLTDVKTLSEEKDDAPKVYYPRTYEKYQLALYAYAKYKEAFLDYWLAVLYLKPDGQYLFKILTLAQQIKALDKAMGKVEDSYKKRARIFA